MARKPTVRKTPVKPKARAKTKPRAKKALSNTAPVGNRKDINIRKISNGWVVSTSSTDAKGNYVNNEVFTTKEPTIGIK